MVENPALKLFGAQFLTGNCRIVVKLLSYKYTREKWMLLKMTVCYSESVNILRIETFSS